MSDKKYVLVETVSMFRMRYVIGLDEELNEEQMNEYACDTVIMNEAAEFSQKHIDEVIVSSRIIDEDEALVLCDNDNDYAQDFSDAKKKELFFTALKGDGNE